MCFAPEAALRQMKFTIDKRTLIPLAERGAHRHADPRGQKRFSKGAPRPQAALDQDSRVSGSPLFI